MQVSGKNSSDKQQLPLTDEDREIIKKIVKARPRRAFIFLGSIEAFILVLALAFSGSDLVKNLTIILIPLMVINALIASIFYLSASRNMKGLDVGYKMRKEGNVYDKKTRTIAVGGRMVTIYSVNFGENLEFNGSKEVYDKIEVGDFFSQDYLEYGNNAYKAKTVISTKVIKVGTGKEFSF